MIEYALQIGKLAYGPYDYDDAIRIGKSLTGAVMLPLNDPEILDEMIKESEPARTVGE